MEFEEAYVEFGEKVTGISEEAKKEAEEKGWKYEFGTYFEGLGKFLAVYSEEMAKKFEENLWIFSEEGKINVESWDYVSFKIPLKGAIEVADEIVKALRLEIRDESEFGDYYEVVSSDRTLRFYKEKILVIIPRCKVKDGKEKAKEVFLTIP